MERKYGSVVGRDSLLGSYLVAGLILAWVVCSYVFNIGEGYPYPDHPFGSWRDCLAGGVGLPQFDRQTLKFFPRSN